MKWLTLFLLILVFAAGRAGKNPPAAAPRLFVSHFENVLGTSMELKVLAGSPSSWLKKLAEADILRPEKKGRTIYFINHKLVELLSTD